METKEIFSQEIQVGLKTLKVRKWKAKDRKNFKKLIRTDDDVSKVIKDTLVYSCLEDKSVALTENEIQYLFIQLRKISVSPTFTFTFTCQECENDNTVELKLDDVAKPVFKEYVPIKTETNEIILQDIKNKQFYYENKDEFDDIKEMAFRIYSINGDNTMGFNKIVNYLEELDVNEFDSIFEQFNEIVFNIDNICSLTCDKCKKETKFEFDEIANFFPDSWTK